MRYGAKKKKGAPPRSFFFGKRNCLLLFSYGYISVKHRKELI